MSDSTTTAPEPAEAVAGEVVGEPDAPTTDLVERAQEIIAAPAVRPDYRLAMEMGRSMAQSGYFADAKEEAQAAVKMIIGLDLGISPTAAMTAIHIVKGKPQIGYPILAAKIIQHRYYGYEVLTHHDEACEVAFTDSRKGTPEVEEDPGADPAVLPKLANEIGRVDWTIERAKEIGLVKNESGWANYPRNMLIARCMSDGVKWYLPDLITGAAVYVDDEIPDDRRSLTPSTGRPPALADERAEELRQKAREAHGKLTELNPGLMPPGAFAKRLTDVGHSHVELEALVDHVGDLAEVEGTIAATLDELRGEVDADTLAEVRSGLERKRGQRDKLAHVEKALADARKGEGGEGS